MKLSICPALLCLTLFLGCSAYKPAQEPLHPAELSDIRTGGELAERIDRNFDRLETEYYHPENVYWSEKQSGGWPADKEGRTILALTMDAQASGRTPKYLRQLVEMLPAHLNAKGYMGTIHPGADEQQLSGHGWLLRGLCEYYGWTGDKKALDAAKTIADSLFLPIAPLVDTYPADPAVRIAGAGDMSGSAQNTVNGWRLSSDVGCVFIGMDGLIQYYGYDRDPQIKALIDRLAGLYLGIDPVRIKMQTHAYLTALRGLLRYADLSGNDSLVAQGEKNWQTYKDYGMTENFENYNWFGRYDTWTEPCAIIDSYLAAVQLWAKTRNPAYLEDAEKIYLNGVASTQRANGGFGCDKPVGVDFHALSIHADEAYWCCTMRGGEGLGRAAQYAYFTAGDTLFVPFYRENEIDWADKGFSMSQTTAYPFGDAVEFSIKKAPRQKMTLALSSPSYMEVKKLSINGTDIPLHRKNGFIHLSRKFSTGDKITMEYDFPTRWEPLMNKDIADTSLRKAMYGPLVLGAATDKPLVLENVLPPVRQGDSYLFSIPRTHDTLAPLQHRMDPSVSIDSKYRRQVIARIKPAEPFARMGDQRKTNSLHPDASENPDKK